MSIQNPSETNSKLVQDITGSSGAEVPPHLARVLEMITDAFIALDEGDHCVYVNGNAERILGRSRKELLGVSVWTAFPDAIDLPFRQATVRARAEHLPVHCENFFSSYGLWIENQIYPTADGLLFVFFRDVTARRTAEKERDELLRLTQQRAAELEAIIEHLPAGVYVGNHDGITACNTLAASMLGFDSTDELRQAIPVLSDLTQTRDAETQEKITAEQLPFARALRGETCSKKLMVRQVVTGEDLVMRCLAAPIKENGRVIAAIAIKTDITKEWTQARRERGRRAASESESAERATGSKASFPLAPLTFLEIPSQEKLSVRSYRDGDTHVVVASGEAMKDSLAPLEAALCQEATEGAARVTVDLSQVGFIDSHGLSLLIAASKRLRCERMPLAPRVLVTRAQQPDRALRMGGFSSIIEILQVSPAGSSAADAASRESFPWGD